MERSDHPTAPGRGFSHVGLGTRDMDATIDFYNGVLGFPIRRYDELIIEEGGRCRHVFFECGHGQLLSFLAPEGVPGLPGDPDTSLTKEVTGVHFAFEAGSVGSLKARREQLRAHGLEVTQIVDHDWCNSIYFTDPVNGLRLEFCTMTRDFTEEDARFKLCETLSINAFRPMALDERDAVLQRAQNSRFDNIDQQSTDEQFVTAD